jgi:hypothetical protein
LNSQYFENLLDAISKDERYRGEMVAAKQEFEQVAGQIMESDESFEARMNAFHNWYILDRPMSQNGMTPLQYFLEFNANATPEDTAQHYRELLDNLHSVFELLRFSHGRAWVRDLISRKKHLVEGAEQLDFLERGDLINTRLFRHGGNEYLTNYLLLHPHSVTKMIRAEAKKVRKSKEDPKPFLFRLLFFHSRWEQFTQMDVDKIYRFGTSLHGQPAL